MTIMQARGKLETLEIKLWISAKRWKLDYFFVLFLAEFVFFLGRGLGANLSNLVSNSSILLFQRSLI